MATRQAATRHAAARPRYSRAARPLTRRARAAASAVRIAAKASSARAGSGPPACAMSGLPPPPLPPRGPLPPPAPGLPHPPARRGRGRWRPRCWLGRPPRTAAPPRRSRSGGRSPRPGPLSSRAGTSPRVAGGKGDSVDVFRDRRGLAAAGGAQCHLALQFGELALRVAAFLDQGRDAWSGSSPGVTRSRAAACCSRCSASSMDCSAACPATASMRLTPAETPLFGGDPEQADIAGAPDMGAAAQLERPGAPGFPGMRIAHRDDPHLVAVLLPEQRHRGRRRRPGRGSSGGSGPRCSRVCAG